jgi:hypothetical protein
MHRFVTPAAIAMPAESVCRRRHPQSPLRIRVLGRCGATEPASSRSRSCHCGNIHVRLRLCKPPEDNPLRACTCSFCRSHNPRMPSDPDGRFEVWADDWSLVQNYRFGTRTCDFLICRRCGVFIAAVSGVTATTALAVVNVNCWSDRARFTGTLTVHDFDGETVESRSSRRNANWMPATTL